MPPPKRERCAVIEEQRGLSMANMFIQTPVHVSKIERAIGSAKLGSHDHRQAYFLNTRSDGAFIFNGFVHRKAPYPNSVQIAFCQFPDLLVAHFTPPCTLIQIQIAARCNRQKLARSGPLKASTEEGPVHLTGYLQISGAILLMGSRWGEPLSRVSLLTLNLHPFDVLLTRTTSYCDPGSVGKLRPPRQRPGKGVTPILRV